MNHSSSAERKPEPNLPHAEAAPWRTCRVIASTDSNWLVRDGAATQRMRRALSCLLLPEPGDLVACLPAGEGGCGWIVAVLERPAQAAAGPQRLRVEGDLALEVQGRWQVEAREADLQAEALSLRAGAVRTSFDSLRSVGRLVEATVSCTRWVGQELTAVVERWSQHAQTSLRHTRGMDRTQAGHVELQAEGVMHVEGRHVLTEGASLVKTRGGQIHFGG